MVDPVDPVEEAVVRKAQRAVAMGRRALYYATQAEEELARAGYWPSYYAGEVPAPEIAHRLREIGERLGRLRAELEDVLRKAQEGMASED